MMKITLSKKIEGYELDAEYDFVNHGDKFLKVDGTAGTWDNGIGVVRLILTPERKVLDWSKIDGNVRVKDDQDEIWSAALRSTKLHSIMYVLSNERQPHILGDKCPVDPKACYVHVMNKDDDDSEGIAGKLDWGEVSWFRVLRLVEGYEYE